MNTRKPPEKDGTCLSAPSVRDDASAAFREQGSDDGFHEFDEAYMQAYVSYKRLREELGQEGVEEGEEEEEVKEEQEEGSPQVLIECMSDINSPTASSTFAPREAQVPHRTHAAVYREQVVLPLHQHHPAQPRYHQGVHSAPAQTRFAQETPYLHHTAAPLLHASSAPYRLQQQHQTRHANHAQSPLARCNCGADNNAVRPAHFQDIHTLRCFSCERRGASRHSDVLPYRGGVSDGYFGRRHEDGGEQRGSHEGIRAEESEVFETFAEVFNAMRKIDAHILALRKALEGLLLEKFGRRAAH